jgi:O-antigen ligase
MPPLLASLLFVIGIAGLFMLDRDPDARTSRALFVPLASVWLAGSRSAAEWLAISGLGPPIDPDANLYMDGSEVDRNVLGALMAISLVVLLRRQQFRTLLKANAPLIIFFLFAAASALWSDFPGVTIRRWFKGVGDLIVVLVVLTDPDRKTAIKRLFVWTGFLLIPHSVLLIKYYPAIGRSYNRWTYMYSFIGTAEHKNLLGAVCDICGIAFVWSFLKALRGPSDPRRGRRLFAHGAALAMVLWLFHMADSVTSLSCFTLASGFLIATGSGAESRRPWLAPLLVVLLIAVPFSAIFLGIASDTIEDLGRDSTLTGRTAIWSLVLSEAGSPIVGTGYESYWLGDRLERIRNAHAGLNESHNGYLEIFLTLGWIGVAIFAAVIVWGYRNLIATYREEPDIGRLRMAFFIAAIVMGFTEVAFRFRGIVWMAFLTAVVVVPVQSTQSAAEKDALRIAVARAKMTGKRVSASGPGKRVHEAI